MNFGLERKYKDAMARFKISLVFIQDYWIPLTPVTSPSSMMNLVEEPSQTSLGSGTLCLGLLPDLRSMNKNTFYSTASDTLPSNIFTGKSFGSHS